MLNALRPAIGRATGPLAARLLSAGVSPDAVTLAGTVGVVAGALALLSTGHFFWGSLAVLLSVLTDMVDGAMARRIVAAGGRRGPYGAWLDSTCDRVADAAVLGALVWWLTGPGDDRLLAGVALFSLVAGLVVSYEKARAEGLGMRCDVGLAERAERLTIVLIGTFLLGFGAPQVVLDVVLWVLAVASAVTVAQRAVEVRRQAALPA